MKRVFILLGLLVALQLSAQNPDFRGGKDQQPGNEGSELTGAPAQKPCPFNDKNVNRPGRDENRPPFFQQEGRGEFAPLPLDKLSDKDRETVEGYLKELHKTLAQNENELFLKKAELRYLTHIDKPDISQIANKLDEIGKLEASLQLEKIKFEIKIREQFPDLGENFKQGPRPQAPEAGAPAPNGRPEKPQAKKR
jgi:hypothetical protein